MLIWPRNSKLSPVGLRSSLTVTGCLSPMLCVVPGQVLAADGEVGDEAVLALGALLGGKADVEHGGRDVLALAGFLQHDVGIAVHQAVDRGEVPDLVRARRRLGLRFRLGEGEIRRDRHQTEQAEQERAHVEIPEW